MMIPMPAGTQIWVACGDHRYEERIRWLGHAGAKTCLKKAAHSGHRSCFRGKRADRIKRFVGGTVRCLCLYAKRLEAGEAILSGQLTREGAAILTPAQLSMLCEGIDWRAPVRTDAAMRAADAMSERVIVNLTNIVFIGSR